MAGEGDGVEQRKAGPELFDSAVFHCPLGIRLDCLADVERRSALCARVPGVTDEAPEVKELVESVLRCLLLVKLLREPSGCPYHCSLYHRLA